MLRARAALVLSLVVASALGGAGCGYRAVTAYRARGGAQRLHVRAFENDSTDPALGAVLTAALRSELARRGSSAPADAAAQLDGSVRVASGTPSSYFNAAQAVTVEIHARLSVDGKLVHELTIQRSEAHQGGADALEAEGRRATALHKLAREAAREVLAAMEEQAR